MLLPQEIQAYWDEYASYPQLKEIVWGSEEFFLKIKEDHEKAYQYSNEILNIPSHRGKSVLEICCGIGLDALELAKHSAKVTFISPSSRLVELTKKYFTYQGLNAKFNIMNDEKLYFQANSFDIVVARGILMFVPHPEIVLGEIYRVLKPSGKAYVHLHNRYSWYVLLAKLSGTKLVHEKKEPPISWQHTKKDANRMFSRFSTWEIYFDRLPLQITKRYGFAVRLYNGIFVPIFSILPKSMIRRFGYYMIIKATK